MLYSIGHAVAQVIRSDGDRRDTLYATANADVFQLSNDGKTDTILNMKDGTDKIDLTAIDASWDQLQVKRLSLTGYVIEYQGEETIRVTFNRPPNNDIPDSGILIDETDFIFREGLPDATVQVQLDRFTSQKETLEGTSSPDVFVLTDDRSTDVIRQFEIGKDQIDLADYGVDFGDLRIVEKREGRVVINVPGAVDGRDKIVLIDVSRTLTAEDITEDFFIF